MSSPAAHSVPVFIASIDEQVAIMSTTGATFVFNNENVPGDGTCFYHSISSAMFGKVSGESLREEAMDRWESKAFYNKLYSVEEFHTVLFGWMAVVSCGGLDIDTALPAFRRRYAQDPDTVHEEMGKRLFSGSIWADELIINIMSLMFNVEITVIHVDLSSKYSLSDFKTRVNQFPRNFTDDTKCDFINWNPEYSVAVAYINARFYSQPEEEMYPDHFTTIGVQEPGGVSMRRAKQDGPWPISQIEAQLIPWILIQ